MLFEDIEGRILMSEEVNRLSPYEIEERQLHVHNRPASLIKQRGGVVVTETMDAMDVDQKIGYWRSMLIKIDKNMFRMKSERIDVKYRLEHLQVLQKKSA